MKETVEIFKALSDETRLKIVWVLNRAKTSLCVCEIMDALFENQYNVSRHLKILKTAGLVDEEKIGRWVFYSFKEPPNRFRKTIVKALADLEDSLFEEEQVRLKRRLALRKNGQCVIGMNDKKTEVKDKKGKF